MVHVLPRQRASEFGNPKLRQTVCQTFHIHFILMNSKVIDVCPSYMLRQN